MKISKVKLINWHAFENETVEFKGNLIITGANGSGKSTLMDAIYYVLSGGDTKNFNNAANNGDNHNSKRTLETYILHKIGDEGKECLRSRPIISHICIEFDDEKGSSFILGAVIELTDTGTFEKFYTKTDSHIDDSYFISPDNKIFSFSELKHKTDATDITKTSKIARQRLICKEVLKLSEGTRYVDLLQRSIAFRPIDEVSDFVDSFLLDDDQIDITPLREELRAYKGIYDQVKKTREKIDYLSNFIESAKKYKECQSNFKLLNPLLSEAKIQFNEIKIDELKAKNEKFSADNKRIDDDIKTIEDKISGLNIEKSKLEEEDVIKLAQDKTTALEQAQKKEKELSNTIEKYNLVLKEEQEILTFFKLSYSFRKDIEEDNFDLFDKHRNDYSNFVSKANDEFVSDMTKLNSESKKIESRIKEINNTISELQQHHNIYPEPVMKLQNLLSVHLKTRYGKDIIIRPLCEYLEFGKGEMNRWSNAIEAYLAPYRFGLVVENKYYDECIRFYDENKAKEEVQGVKIYKINAPVFMNLKTNPNSIFSKLDVSEKKVKYLCHQLFNDVICFDSLDDLMKYDGNGLLDTCVMFKEQSFIVPNPDLYQFPYIGEQSFNIRIRRLEDERDSLNEKYNEVSTKIAQIEKKRKVLKNNKSQDILRLTDVWTHYKKIIDDVKNYQADIELYKSNPGFVEISNKIQEIQEQIKQLSLSKDELGMKKAVNQQTIGGNNSTIESLKSENEQLSMAFGQQYYQVKGLASQYSALKDGFYDEQGHLDKVKIENAKNNCQYTIASLTNVLKEKIDKYVEDYNNGLSSDLNDIDQIIAEYGRLCHTDIIKFEAQASQARESSENMFRDDFISKLFNNIKSAKENINAINDNLKNHPFGTNKEIYKFLYLPSKDEEMRKYYKIITSGKLMQSKELFDELLSEEENQTMENLFNQIVETGDDSVGEKNLAKLLDYRKYMTYDIETTNERGEKSLFSKTHREKSGGETQTPFYVIIASCFDELMDKKHGLSSCPVIFDEAFNNMDETRIDALMRYYRELGIQLIIVVPSNRVASLAQFVDTIAALVTYDHQVNIVYMKTDLTE